VEETRPDDVGVSVSYPLPGTKFYEGVKAQLGAKTHWNESSDLDMMFAGTYRSEFYRAVRNLLHDEVKQPQSPSVARRWDELCAREGEFRQLVPPARPLGELFGGLNPTPACP
jgi:anaerobic magnesium-protoporphyrin IX monomethyl ester cyclase